MPPLKPRLLVVSRREAREKSRLVILDSHAFEIRSTTTPEQALASLENQPTELILVDTFGDAVDPLDLWQECKKRQLEAAVVVLGDAGQEAQLAEMCRQGIAGYALTTAPLSVVEWTLERALVHHNLCLEAEQLRQQLREQSVSGLGAMVGTSSAMQAIYRKIRRAASSRASWLISGESGAGKRTLARLIHVRGRRPHAPLVEFRTTGPEDTTAHERLLGPNGCLAAAAGGTLLLDHVERIAPALQLALLHALEEPHGARDVRVVSTAGPELARDVGSGRFRADLYDRLRTVEVELPPLRERATDVLLLADLFLRRFAEQHQRSVQDFAPSARAKLTSHNWPGNVRALEQVVESAVVSSEGQLIEASGLGFEADASSPHEPKIPGSKMADIERHVILKTLDSVAGSTARAAEVLDVSVRTIQYRLNEYGITPKRQSGRPPRMG